MVATQRTGCSGLRMVTFQLIWRNGGREGGSVGSAYHEDWESEFRFPGFSMKSWQPGIGAEGVGAGARRPPELAVQYSSHTRWKTLFPKNKKTAARQVTHMHVCALARVPAYTHEYKDDITNKERTLMTTCNAHVNYGTSSLGKGFRECSLFSLIDTNVILL